MPIDSIHSIHIGESDDDNQFVQTIHDCHAYLLLSEDNAQRVHQLYHRLYRSYNPLVYGCHVQYVYRENIFTILKKWIG
jgi:hypothetical protein